MLDITNLNMTGAWQPSLTWVGQNTSFKHLSSAINGKVAFCAAVALGALIVVFVIKRLGKKKIVVQQASRPAGVVNLPDRPPLPPLQQLISSPHHPLIQELGSQPAVPEALDARKMASETYFKNLERDFKELRDAKTPISENILCEYLSHLFINLTGKRLAVLSFDLGGFGDFTFGCKAVSILQRRFPGLTVVLGTDNPTRALKVNASYNHALLMPSIPPDGKLDQASVCDLIQHFDPHFLLVAPVVHILNGSFKRFFDKTAHLLLREYGFDRGFSPPVVGEYITGAGDRDWKGVLTHEDLIAWSNSEDADNHLKTLSHLRNLPAELTLAILETPFSEVSCSTFDKGNELFMAYGNEYSLSQFIFSISEMHARLRIDKNPTVVLLGNPTRLPELLQEHSALLTKAGIGSVEWIDLNANQVEMSKAWKVGPGGKKIKLISVVLLPEDTIHLIKASEKETATTGDHSWIEGISACKRWVQQDLVHKRASLRSVLDSAKTIPDIDPNFVTNLCAAHKPYNIFNISLPRIQAQTELFIESRVNPRFARGWQQLNDRVRYENGIEDWLVGMVIKRYLEHNYPAFKERTAPLLQNSNIDPQMIISYFYDLQQFLKGLDLA